MSNTTDGWFWNRYQFPLHIFTIRPVMVSVSSCLELQTSVPLMRHANINQSEGQSQGIWEHVGSWTIKRITFSNKNLQHHLFNNYSFDIVDYVNLVQQFSMGNYHLWYWRCVTICWNSSKIWGTPLIFVSILLYIYIHEQPLTQENNQSTSQNQIQGPQASGKFYVEVFSES